MPTTAASNQSTMSLVMYGPRALRARRRLHAALPIAVLFTVCVALRIVAATRFDAPWIAPDEMIYGLAGRSFWASGHATLLGVPAPFYGIYPLLVGLPLHVLDTATAVSLVQWAQAILMSLTAVIVWAWVKPLAGSRWALAGAALTACLPALAYSGLLMSEAVSLPAGTLALWLASRTIAEPTRARQVAVVAAILLAAAARLQGVVLVPIVVAAAALAAAALRDRAILTRLALTWMLLGAAAAVWFTAHLAATGDAAGTLGAYAGTVNGSYAPREVLRWIFREAGDVFLLVAGVPLVATCVLAYECLRRREQDVRVVASTAVAVSTAAMLTLQVGVFASRYVGQLAERYLIVAAPPLFACFVVWLARGLPRPQPATAVIALAVAVPALLLPLRQLVTPYAAPDAFMTIPLRRLQEATSWGTTVAVWTLAAALLVGLAVVVPRRAGAVLAVLVGAVLAVSAVVSSGEVSRLTRHDRTAFFAGSSPAWVDAAADAPVVELYAGSSYWNAVWSTAFWNERLTRVVQLPGTPFSGVSVPVVKARPDGTLVEAGSSALRARYVVAPPTIAFSGEPVAQAAAQGLDIAGQRLWRTDGTVKLAQLTVGIQPNGDLTAPVDVFVYDCSHGHGSLELTLLGKMPATVEIRRSGLRVMQFTVAPDSVWRGSVAAPPEAHGGVCSYEILASALVGSTQIEYVRN